MDPVCVYCGEVAETKDHVPPKCFFPKPYPENLLTVPACERCNQNLSKDEDYARIVLSSARVDGEELPLAEVIWEQKVSRSLRRNTKIAFDIYNSMRAIDANNLAFRIDRNRLDKIIVKIVKGLYFAHFQKRIDDSYTVSVHLFPGQQSFPHFYPHELIESILSSPIRTIGEGVLRYRWITSDENDNFSVWVLSFYNTDYNNFVVWTLPPYT